MADRNARYGESQGAPSARAADLFATGVDHPVAKLADTGRTSMVKGGGSPRQRPVGRPRGGRRAR